jgi:hypothetical protein
MITATGTTTPGRGSIAMFRREVEDASDAEGPGRWCWVEPGTLRPYPLAYRAYRRAREAEEKAPPRHRALGPDIDHYVWQRGLIPATQEVGLAMRPDTSPRIRRIVAEVLRAIRRGQPAGAAIRRVAKRFGLRQTQARAFIAASIRCEVTRAAGPPPG